jgi:hypothetical protein
VEANNYNVPNHAMDRIPQTRDHWFFVSLDPYALTAIEPSMSAHDDIDRYREEEAMENFIEEQLRELSEGPVIYYFARFGDAIEARVQSCRSEADALSAAGFHGAALVRLAAAIEITIRFYLARPLVQGAFLSDEWAALLSSKMLKGRTAEDRKLLPAILRNWKLDITQVKLADGSQMWDRILSQVWPRRNDYAHEGDTISEADERLAAECLEAMLTHVVSPIASQLGFTREETGKWSVILSPYDRAINPPTTHERASPFAR